MKYFIFALVFIFLGCSNESHSLKKDSDILFTDYDSVAEDEDIYVDEDEDLTDFEDDDDDDSEISDEEFSESDVLSEEESDSEPDEDTEANGFPECSSYKRPVSSAVLKNDNLKEISGAAVSYINKGILWVHNDSGGKASLFAIKHDGSIVAELALDGAVNIDWEDLSLNPCGEEECLYVADIGDNSLNRNDYAVYKVKEPLLSDTSETVITVSDWVKYPVSYEDSSKNSEAMAIDPEGKVYIFSKEIGLTNVYMAESLSETGTEFKYIGVIDTGTEISGYPAEAQPSLVTGADINRNGTRLLLRTYGIYTTQDDGIMEFAFNKGNFEEVFTQEPLMVPEGNDMQGESIAYDPYTGGYVHISEYYFKVVDFDPNIWTIDCNN